MTRRILKFTLHPGATEIVTADIPCFLAVGAQGPDVVVWAEATPGDGVTSLVASVMTGESAPGDGEYIGTAQIDSGLGPLVVHAYRHIR